MPGVAPDASGADGAGEAVLAVLPATPVSAVLAAAACLAGSGARSDAVAPLCDPGVLFDAGLAAVEAVAWPVFCAGAVAVDLAVAPSCAFADAPAARVAAAVALSGDCAALFAAGAGSVVLPDDAAAGAAPATGVEAAWAFTWAFIWVLG